MSASCPFCGDDGPAAIVTQIINAKVNAWALCPTCGARGPNAMGGVTSALTLWNNREAPGTSEAWRKQFKKIT